MGVLLQNNKQVRSDFSLTLTRHPITGDITSLQYLDAIDTSITNLLQTADYEYPFDSDLGSRLKYYLFEPMTPLVALAVQTEVTNVISTHEPRIELVDVIVSNIDNGFSIKVLYVVRNDLYGNPLSTSVNIRRVT